MTHTPEQEAIFQFVREGSGHGIIDAVAGAGKTTTIMECARYAADPGRVLFCAFNSSIAREIKAKFQARGMSAVCVQTIHALGFRMLRDNLGPQRQLKVRERKYQRLYQSPAFQAKLRPLLAALARLHGYRPPGEATDGKRQFAVKQLLYRAERRLLDINMKHRSVLIGPTFPAFAEMVRHFGIFTHPEEISNVFQEELELYHRMHRLLLRAGTELAAREGVIDFTDMIYLPFVWQLTASLRYDWIFIDECQDLSKAQFAVAAKYGRTGSRVLAVGDPRQSIYGFTGADVESFGRVRRMTRATEWPLNTCFRCPAGVIELAREIRPDLVGAKAAAGLVETITPEEVPVRAKAGDLIISRFRAPLLLLLFDFIDANVRVRVHPDEAEEFIGELKVLFKPGERKAPIRERYRTFAALRQQVTARNQWVIRQQAAHIAKATEREAFIETETGYLEKRLDFLERKQRRWRSGNKSVAELLERLHAAVSAKKNAVKLSTIHRAKGLEERRVFILDYDRLPFTRQGQKDWERVQETNLKYVAITRAMETLFLVRAAEPAAEAEEGSLYDDLAFED